MELETLRGNKLSESFDPILAAAFVEAFNSTYHLPWQPIYKSDMKLQQAYDFFKTIVNRVKNFNESYDIMVTGSRGIGKSAFAVGSAIIIHREFVGDPTAMFPLDRVCFDVQAWQDVCSNIKGGGVVILDEVGTEGSLSSRTSMSKGNRESSDIIQLMRTDRIITIYISTDTGRIDKRVRELATVNSTPIGKLTDDDTNGYGLAIEADVKYSRTVPRDDANSDVEYLSHEILPLQYGPKGVIHSIVVPHAPADVWNGYEAKRAVKLEAVRAAGEAANDGDEVLAENAALRKELSKLKGGGKRKKKAYGEDDY